MAQTPAAYSIYIRAANGQQQMVKVVQSKQANPIQLQTSAMKTLFKVPGTSDSNPVYRNVNVTGIKGQKYVQIPRETINQYQKGAVENPVVQATTTAKKVQTQSSSEGTKLMRTIPTLVQQTAKQNAQVVTVKTEDDKNFLSNTILGYSHKKRHEPENDVRLDYSSKRRKMVEKVGKGLRHFSMKVCEKVRRKGFTSYNEVADELVAEFTEGLNACPNNQHYDQKNIRRRVYDALNVLMAMNIISKEKKEIRWLGLPTNSVQECSSLEAEKQIKLERIQQKTQQLHDLILKQISFKCLVERNKEAECKGLTPSPTSAIQLPFIVVNTSDKTLIDCSISDNKLEYVFNFNDKFQIQDDIDILKRMGLLLGLDKGNCSEANLKKAKSMIPKSLESYIDQLAKGDPLKMDELFNLKNENDEPGEGSANGEEDLDECDDEYSLVYSDEGEDEQDSCSDVEIN